MHPWAIKICHWKWELNQCLHRDWSLNKFVIRSYLYSICVFSLFFQPFGTKNKTLLFTMWRYLLLKHSWSETVVILVKVWAEVKLNLRHFIFFIQNVCASNQCPTYFNLIPGGQEAETSGTTVSTQDKPNKNKSRRNAAGWHFIPAVIG